jgi:hypothetical protein
MRVAGVYYNNLGGVTPLVLDDAVVVGTQLVTVTAAAASWPVFNTSGAPYTTLALGVEFVMAAAGVGGQTIQLQTSLGVACTEAIPLAAVAQWGIAQNNTLLYPVAVVAPGQNFNLVTAGGPTGLAIVTLVRVNA